MKQEKRTGNSITRRIKRMILMLVPLSALYIGISIASTWYFRMQINRYAETFVDVVMEDIETTVGNINRRISMLILGEGEAVKEMDSYLRHIRFTTNSAYRNYFIRRLQDVFLTYSMEYGKAYQFFAFFPQDGQYVGANTNERMGQEIWEEVRGDITWRLNEGLLSPNSGSQHWQFVDSSLNNDYIIKFYSIKDVYVGCWILPSDLIAPLENAVKDTKSTAQLLDLDHGCLWGEEMSGKATITIERRFSHLPFQVRLAVHDYGLFQRTVLMQLLLVGIALGMLCAVLSSVYYLYSRVMRPIKKFSDNLERISRGRDGLEEISSSELLELEQANARFRQLLSHIDRLQEEIYERERKKQKMDMEYLKLQIEPHFYLNCLNFIYNMVDLRQYSQASKMAVMTAEYMRYLFHHEQNFVRVWEELEHTSHYLEIQKLRFSSAFTYYIEQEEETRAQWILPLMIQTFVENCIKYAMDFDSCLQITITVFSEEVDGAPWMNLCVADSGPGFPDALLVRLEDQKRYREEEKEHIGIANTLKRIHYLYGEQAKISFYNGPGKGAVVDMHLPCEVPGERGMELDEAADC